MKRMFLVITALLITCEVNAQTIDPKKLAEKVYRQAVIKINNAEWARSKPARNVWPMFETVQRDVQTRRPKQVIGFYKEDGSSATRHVQGVTRLTDGRFVFAHSTFETKGHWYVQVAPDSEWTKAFVYGHENHPSPLQASGNLVFAPLTWLGSKDSDITCSSDKKARMAQGKEASVFMMFNTNPPNAFSAPNNYFCAPGRSGITYHHKLGKFFFVVNDRMYVQHNVTEVKKVKLSGGTPNGGEAGINLVYDETNQNIYVFGFHDSCCDQSGDTLTIQEYELSDEGYSAKKKRQLDIPFHSLPFDATPEGTSWQYGGGMRVTDTGIELYKTDMGGDAAANKMYVAIFEFLFTLAN